MIALRILPLVALATFCVAACGVGQSIRDGTVNAAKRTFTTPTNTMNLDVLNRSSSAANDAGSASPTIVRIYQLKTPEPFRTLDDAALFAEDHSRLKADLLSTNDVVLQPDASVSFSVPMHGDVHYVGIVIFAPDADHSARLLIPKSRWARSNPVKVEVSGSHLRLIGS